MKTKILNKKTIVSKRNELNDLLEEYTNIFQHYMGVIEKQDDKQEIENLLEASETILLARKQIKLQLQVFDLILNVNDDYELNLSQIQIK